MEKKDLVSTSNACFILQATSHSLVSTNAYFYTTDTTGELAPSMGFACYGIACRVLPATSTEGVAFHRWFNGERGFHFYTTDPAGEIAAQNGYRQEGVQCHVFTQPTPHTVPLYRYLTISGDHLYSINSGIPAYKAEGVVAYVYPPSSQEGIPLFEWYVHGTDFCVTLWSSDKTAVFQRTIHAASAKAAEELGNQIFLEFRLKGHSAAYKTVQGGACKH